MSCKGEAEEQARALEQATRTALSQADAVARCVQEGCHLPLINGRDCPRGHSQVPAWPSMQEQTVRAARTLLGQPAVQQVLAASDEAALVSLGSGPAAVFVIVSRQKQRLTYWHATLSGVVLASDIVPPLAVEEDEDGTPQFADALEWLQTVNCGQAHCPRCGHLLPPDARHACPAGTGGAAPGVRRTEDEEWALINRLVPQVKELDKVMRQRRWGAETRLGAWPFIKAVMQAVEQIERPAFDRHYECPQCGAVVQPTYAGERQHFACPCGWGGVARSRGDGACETNGQPKPRWIERPNLAQRFISSFQKPYLWRFLRIPHFPDLHLDTVASSDSLTDLQMCGINLADYLEWYEQRAQEYLAYLGRLRGNWPPIPKCTTVKELVQWATKVLRANALPPSPWVTTPFRTADGARPQLPLLLEVER